MARIAAALLLAVLIASLGGAWHPAGDSLAVFRPAYAVLLLLCLPWLGRGMRLVVAAAVVVTVLAGLWAALPGRTPPVPTLTVYHKNLLFRMEDPAAIIANIRASGADLVTLAEVSERNLAVPRGLADVLPYQNICPSGAVGAVAVLSRYPLAAPPICEPGSGAAALVIASPAGRLTVLGLHLHWPWPSIQAQQVRALLPLMRDLPQPVIVGGDFNMVPDTHTLRAIAQATGTTRLPSGPTFMLRGLYPITIDHILMPDGWRGVAETRPPLGSDHRGLLARLQWNQNDSVAN